MCDDVSGRALRGVLQSHGRETDRFEKRKTNQKQGFIEREAKDPIGCIPASNTPRAFFSLLVTFRRMLLDAVFCGRNVKRAAPNRRCQRETADRPWSGLGYSD